MPVERLAAFSVGDTGGNPAGIVLLDALPAAAAMQAVAARVAYPETAFAGPEAEGWRVRYVAPKAEVEFCGHATVARAAAPTSRPSSPPRRSPDPARQAALAPRFRQASKEAGDRIHHVGPITDVLEGGAEPLPNAGLFEFPSRDAALGFYRSEACAPVREERRFAQDARR